MNHLLITILTVCFIILCGCSSQKTISTQQGYPSAYVEGHHHGCREGEYQSNNNYNQRKAKTIKDKHEALIEKILSEDNEPAMIKGTEKEHQAQQAHNMAFKASENEGMSIDSTSTILLSDSPSADTKATYIDMPSKLKVLATVSDYMHINAHKNPDWSEKDFQYEKGWSDAFFECKGIATAKAAASKRGSQITNFGLYENYEVYNNYSYPFKYDWFKEEQQRIMRKYEKEKKARQQQREFQAQQNQLFQRSFEQPTPGIELGQPAIQQPLIDNKQLLQQQLEWQQQNPIIQQSLKQLKPRIKQGRSPITRPVIDGNQLLRQLQNPKIQRMPEKPIIQQLPNNYNRLLQQPKAIVQQPRLQIKSNTPPQLRINRNNPFMFNR